MSYMPITVQRMSPDSGAWADHWHLHATQINKATGSQSFQGEADQFRARLTFDVPYFSGLEALRFDPQLFQIVYRGHAFKVVDYDDYKEQHRTVRLAGEAYG